jgi:hypothetical protein
LKRIRDRDDDALTVYQQVGQVVRDQVADGDRQQARAGGGDPDEPPDRERGDDDDAEEPAEQQRLAGQAGQPEQVKPDLRLR